MCSNGHTCVFRTRQGRTCISSNRCGYQAQSPVPLHAVTHWYLRPQIPVQLDFQSPPSNRVVAPRHGRVSHGLGTKASRTLPVEPENATKGHSPHGIQQQCQPCLHWDALLPLGLGLECNPQHSAALVAQDHVQEIHRHLGHSWGSAPRR